MCGIVGYIGERNATPLLMEGLRALEYRGYDSAGIAVLRDGELHVQKAKGRLSVLEERLQSAPLSGCPGIGHTRWATHGEPSDANSHPHTSMLGDIAVVHNGIIENYQDLKAELAAEGCMFRSETDTEVVAHLIHKYYQGNLLAALLSAVKRLRGAYALAVICAGNPGEIVCARRNSPLVLGAGDGENFLASDIPALIRHTRDVYLLRDGCAARVTKDAISIVDEAGRSAPHEIYHVNWDVAAAEKSGYPHFMLKEMHEQPEALRATISPRLREGRIELEGLSDELLNRFDRIVISACGTAYHAGLVAEYAIESLARIPVEVDIASEYRYRDPIIRKSDLFIVISQSGETADSIAAMRIVKEQGGVTLAVTNTVGSTIARESDLVLYTHAGPEIAVASTKAYTTQLAVLTMLAMELGRARHTLPPQRYSELVQGLSTIHERAREVLESKEAIQKAASLHFTEKDVFFMGRGLDYPATMESSLKLKEISYIHSEALAAGELKHGTIALIEEGRLVIAVSTQPHLTEKLVSNIKEVKARGARILLITTQDNGIALAEADERLFIPQADPMLEPMISVIPAQLLAYYCSVQLGYDPDKPRNLAKSVTVE